MRLYVANFPNEAQESDLLNLFEGYGKVVSAKIILDFETGQRRGFAFVSMPLDYQAERAMRKLDGQAFMGTELVVREARKGSVRNRRAGGDRRRGNRSNYQGPERRKSERREKDRREAK